MAHHCEVLESEFVEAGVQLPSQRVQSYAVAAITESVAFLEALVNELWQCAIDEDANSNPNLAGLPPESIDLLRRFDRYGRVERSLRVLEKYDFVLTCADKPRLDLGRRPGQDVKLLVQLRNALVHYKPIRQWSDQLHKLQKPMTDLGLRNPLHEGLLPWFPGYPLCSDVAQWSWQRSQQFAQEWQRELGLTLPTKLEMPVYEGGSSPAVAD